MKLYNIVKVYTSTVGTGTVTLGSAVPSFITFATAGVVNGSTVSYAIEDGNNREVGTGTYTSGTETLTRNVVTSTNSNNLITLSGNAVVFITGLAADLSSDTANVASTLIQRDGSGNFAAGAATLSSAVVPLVIGGTGTTSTLTLRSTSGVGTAGADIIFQTGNNGATEVMRLQNGGNVGIGTASPASRLNVRNTSLVADAGIVQLLSRTDGPYLGIGHQNWDGTHYAAIGGTVTDGSNNTLGALRFFTRQSSTDANLAERMRIDSNGNVGIGTSSPWTTFNAQGTSGGFTGGNNDGIAQLSTPGGNRLQFGIVDSSYSWIQASKPGVSVYNLALQLGGGNVGIGTSSPSNKLTVLTTGALNTVGDAIDVGATFTGADYAFGAGSNPAILNVHSNSTLGAGVGATIGLGGRYTGTSFAQFAIIKGAKENATDGNYATFLAFGTRANGGNIAERMRIDSSGSVCINTTANGGFKLNVNGSTNLGGTSVVDTSIELNAGGTGNRFAFIDFHGDDTYTDFGLRIIRDNSGPNAYSTFEHRGTGFLLLKTSEAAPIVFFTNGNNERMRILSTGEVGIGAPSPSYKLHVLGADGFGAGTAAAAITTSTTGNSATTLELLTGSGSAFDISLFAAGASPANAVYFNNRNSAPMVFLTGNSERMRILSTGEVGIGESSPAALLHVASGTTTSLNLARIYAGSLASGSAVDMYIGKAASPSQSGTFGFHYNSTSTSSYAYMSIYGDSSTTGITVTPGGKVGIGKQQSTYSLEISADSAAKPTTNTWTIASDSRLKTVKGEYQKGLAEICQVRPVSYEYNGKAGFIADGKDKVSILAQELMQVFPECVDTFKGKLEEDGPEIDLYNYNGHAITFALINAIKELKAKIDILEARN